LKNYTFYYFFIHDYTGFYPAGLLFFMGRSTLE